MHGFLDNGSIRGDLDLFKKDEIIPNFGKVVTFLLLFLSVCLCFQYLVAPQAQRPQLSKCPFPSLPNAWLFTLCSLPARYSSTLLKTSNLLIVCVYNRVLPHSLRSHYFAVWFLQHYLKMHISTVAALATLGLPLVSAQLSSIPQCAVGPPPSLQGT